MLSKKVPSERQAVAFWMYATGTPVEDIAKHFGIVKSSAVNLLHSAQGLAREQRMWFISTKGKDEAPERSGSGMTYLTQLAKEAGILNKNIAQM